MRHALSTPRTYSRLPHNTRAITTCTCNPRPLSRPQRRALTCVGHAPPHAPAPSLGRMQDALSHAWPTHPLTPPAPTHPLTPPGPKRPPAHPKSPSSSSSDVVLVHISVVPRLVILLLRHDLGRAWILRVPVPALAHPSRLANRVLPSVFTCGGLRQRSERGGEGGACGGGGERGRKGSGDSTVDGELRPRAD